MKPFRDDYKTHLLLLLCSSASVFHLSRATAEDVSFDGVSFQCQPEVNYQIEEQMKNYLSELEIKSSHYQISYDSSKHILNFSLNTPKEDKTTLDLHLRSEYAIQDEVIELPTNTHKMRKVSSVSKKEIVLALLQHGRHTVFKNENCSSDALKDYVGVRQNTVAWVEKMEWEWPNGGSAKWNKKYWNRGTPTGRAPLAESLRDTFVNQKKYAIGCYTATKIAMVHGIVDYYDRVKKDPVALQRVTEKLLQNDNEPLVDVEPGKMWFFEDGFDPKELHRPGKVLKMQEQVASRNYVPGDWSYFLNTDKETYQKTGYEGSNNIYLGRNRFDDYYHDQKKQHYTFEEKIDEVYQWRNHVFSRSRDHAKIKPLSSDQFEALLMTPKNHGLILDYRVSPILF